MHHIMDTNFFNFRTMIALNMKLETIVDKISERAVIQTLPHSTIDMNYLVSLVSRSISYLLQLLLCH